MLQLVCVAAALAGTRGIAAAQSLIPVRIGVQPVESAGQAFYGLDLGWFRAAGLDVQLTPLSNGAELVAAVLSGSLDVGLSAVGSVAQAHVKGLNVKLIAPAGMYLSSAPTDVTMVAKDSTIHTAADLTGKTVAVNGIGNFLMYATQAWIDKNGGDSKRVKWIELPFSAMGDALAAHRVDAATLAEPFVSDAQPVARTLAFPLDVIASRCPATTWFANGSWLANQPAVAMKTVDVLRRSAIWANTHPKETGAILLRYTKIKPETLAAMTRSTYGTDLLVSEIQPLIDAGVKYGDIDHALAANDIMWKAPKS